MSSNKENARKLAKNTVVLYGRLIVTMLIALFTSRIVLNALGVEDYGLYNVIGGVVTMLSIITSGLITSTQRYLSYELGNENPINLKKVFSVCFTTHILLAVISFVILESVGLWIVNNNLQIPDGRLGAANWIFQFSVIAFVFQIIVVPYSAAVISHERMTVYAYIGIFDAVIKLLIAYAIYISPIDRISLYGLLMMGISILNYVIYKYICNRDYEETNYTFVHDSSMFKKILSFSSWTMLGQGAMVFCNQSLNVLINMFHSVVANAALGIAQQVNAAIIGLTSNFFTAFQPQITKSYSSGEMQYFTKLVCLTSKISYFMILIVAIPIMMNIEPILKLWLGIVPPNTAIFCCVFVTSSIVNSIGNPFWTAIFANGNIKKLQILSTLLYLLCVIIAYIFFYNGCVAVVALLCKLVTDFFLTLLRVLQTRKLMPVFSYRMIFSNVIIPIIISSLLIVLSSYFSVGFMSTPLLRILITLINILFILCVLYTLGLNTYEKSMLNQYVKNYIDTRNNP